MANFPAEIWQQLTGSQIRLCEEIAFLTRGQGWAYVGREYLSRKLGLTVNHLSTLTSQLQDLGVLEKMQPRRRRKDGTWDTRPCLYRLVPWLAWKLRGIVHRLFGRKATGLRSTVGKAEKKEKITAPGSHFFAESEPAAPLDLGFVRDEKRRAELERFGRLGTQPD